MHEITQPHWVILYGIIIFISWYIIEINPWRIELMILAALIGIPVYVYLVDQFGPPGGIDSRLGLGGTDGTSNEVSYYIIALFPGAVLNIIIGVIYNIVHDIKIKREIREYLREHGQPKDGDQKKTRDAASHKANPRCRPFTDDKK
ncbi:MAG: hypothetical protein IJI20_07730 [Firmicutes bacterium]|nr:hypothetical protein [Bacillota bacterium]